MSRIGTVAILLAVAGGSWVLTVALMSGTGGPGDMNGPSGMDGMGAGPVADLGGLGWFSFTWVAMMAAMMLPSLAPMVLMYAQIQAEHQSRTRRLPTGGTFVFVVGYLVSWSAVGLVGYLVVEGVRSLDVGFLDWTETGRYVAGCVIVGAALYQVSGLKDVCLWHCRTPLTLIRHWRSGRLGALRMGLEHGGFCIGCSWALMAALFALGLMSLGWMAVIAALVALEKLLPWKAFVKHGIAVLLAVLGLTVAYAPAYVPGLVIPG